MVPAEDYVNRRVDLRFAGKELRFDLSLGLFSSASIDIGSRILLKTLSQHVDLNGLDRVIDVGCGVGTLGLAIAARCPQARVDLVDRDALALAFSRRNAELNDLRNINLSHRLLLEGREPGSYTLVISNFPAKAGDPVLKDYLIRSQEILIPGGVAALVIVHTLADRCAELIESTGGRIVLRENGKQHTVFHYAPVNSTKSLERDHQEDELAPYIRELADFKLGRTRYSLETAWNLPDFDTLSWRRTLLGNLLDKEPRRGRVLFWAPGQGHLAASVCLRRASSISQIILAGRDRLQLLLTERNLLAGGCEASIRLLECASPESMKDVLAKESVDHLIADLDPVSRTVWEESFREMCRHVIAPGGSWACVGRSSHLSELAKKTKGFTPIEDKRSRGWRALVYRRNP